jgi:glycosyltransferase involved in cell wall biosynthesis
MKRVALIIPMLQPYRVTFYEKLIESTKTEYQWCIFHGVKNFDDGRPEFKGYVTFEHVPFSTSILKFGPLSVVIQKKLFVGLKKFNPDIIIINANVGELNNRRISLWAKRRARKLIFWVCSWDSGKSRGIWRTLKRFLTKIYYRRADRFIAYSTHAERFIKSFSIPSSSISIAYNGLDLDELKKDEIEIVTTASRLRKELSLVHTDIVFLYVGGLISTKAPLLLVDAFVKLSKKHSNIYLWIIGDGPLQEQVKLNIFPQKAITYFGRITEGVDRYFNAADWFVLPGSGGLALNQAMFWETPCISGFADGTEEDLVLDEISGYRFSNEELNSLINAMEKAIKTSPEKYSKMQQFSKYLIEERSNTNSMLQVFITAISQSTKSDTL